MKEQLKIILGKASNQGLIVLLPILGSLLFLNSARADFNGNLTINVAGVKNQSGKICASIFSGSQGFPS
ncbi:MAG: hypothetical protein ACKPGB_20865, partial [Dolichospermum sp.]